METQKYKITIALSNGENVIVDLNIPVQRRSSKLNLQDLIDQLEAKRTPERVYVVDVNVEQYAL